MIAQYTNSAAFVLSQPDFDIPPTISAPSPSSMRMYARMRTISHSLYLGGGGSTGRVPPVYSANSIIVDDDSDGSNDEEERSGSTRRLVAVLATASPYPSCAGTTDDDIDAMFTLSENLSSSWSSIFLFVYSLRIVYVT